MKITRREEMLMRRALDKASSPTEAAKAAEAFVNSLRQRGINVYELVRPTSARPQPAPEPPKPQPPPNSDFSSAYPDFDSAFDFKRGRPDIRQSESRGRSSGAATQADHDGANLLRIVWVIIVLCVWASCHLPHPPSVATYSPAQATPTATPASTPNPYGVRAQLDFPVPTGVLDLRGLTLSQWRDAIKRLPIETKYFDGSSDMIRTVTKQAKALVEKDEKMTLKTE
jgi:hypothetical protein